MRRFRSTDLEGCIRELAKRSRRDLEGMTPLERNEYDLCRSIERVVREDALKMPPEVIVIARYRRKKTASIG